jgi:hypothetical protein
VAWADIFGKAQPKATHSFASLRVTVILDLRHTERQIIRLTATIQSQAKDLGVAVRLQER